VTEIWLAFLAGLGGSGHCLGMCGGIVAAFSAGGASAGRPTWRETAFFNLGRLSTYSLLGFSAGLAGKALDLLLLRPFSTAVFAVGNLFVVATGIVLLVRQDFPSAPRRLTNGLQRLLPAAIAAPESAAGFLPLGMLFGFLPCGLVYAPLASAAATGDPLRGWAVMAALGAGTFPALFFAGALTSTAASAGRRSLLALAGGALVVMGTAGLRRLVLSM
jgi:uncharacterized protein